MFRKIFLLSFRHMAKNKGYAIINIAGLAIGLAVTVLIGLWIENEISFNRSFSQPARLAEVLSIQTFNGEVQTHAEAAVPLAAELRARFATDFPHVTVTSEGIRLLSKGQNQLEEFSLWVDSGFIPMFLGKNFDARLLDDPGALLISVTMAADLFGKKPAIGQLIRVDNATTMKVAGVFKDFADNSRFAGFRVLVSWQDPANPRLGMEDWSNHHSNVYVQCRAGGDFALLSKKIALLSKLHLTSDWERLALQSFTRAHLYNHFTNGQEDGGSIAYVRLFAAVAVAVLLLACINFINLSTARSQQRSREVGVRKAIGSRRWQLLLQFYGESIVYVICAGLLAVLLIMAALGRFELIAQTRLIIPFRNPFFWFLTGGFLLLTALLAGTYPALYLSSFQPAKVLSRTFLTGSQAGWTRKILVVMQFAVSMTLIFCTLAVLRQISFAKDRPVGYSRSGLLLAEINTPKLREHFDVLRNELLGSGAVTSMTQSSSPATDVQNSMFGYDWAGRDPQTPTLIGTVFTGFDFGKTVEWKIKAGRDFLRDHPADSGAMILNEAAVEYLGFKNPVGSIIRWHDSAHLVIGVVHDLVMESPYMPVKPTIFTLSSKKIHLMMIRLNPKKSFHAALETISKLYSRFDPESSFEYGFTEDIYAAKFAEEDRVAGITGFFAVLAILISALGLFGLASFVTEQRAKEIGIRKVLGASVFSLWKMLTAEFVILVLISVCIAIPAGWYFSASWLDGFAYRATLRPWIFLSTAGSALLITVLTVGFHIVRAAIENPVRRLKSD